MLYFFLFAFIISMGVHRTPDTPYSTLIMGRLVLSIYCKTNGGGDRVSKSSWVSLWSRIENYVWGQGREEGVNDELQDDHVTSSDPYPTVASYDRKGKTTQEERQLVLPFMSQFSMWHFLFWDIFSIWDMEYFPTYKYFLFESSCRYRSQPCIATS